jgi:hypothetical protein
MYLIDLRFWNAGYLSHDRHFQVDHPFPFLLHLSPREDKKPVGITGCVDSLKIDPLPVCRFIQSRSGKTPGKG